MDILTTPGAMHTWRATHRDELGLVPTMGYLHEGHLSLVRRARSENALAAATLFVNPAQFGPGEDYERYPRDEERDLALLRAEGIDAVYLPGRDTMYPDGFQTAVVVEEVTRRLEGAARPGHFRGVATVVAKLLNATDPDRAYFGRKDAQQLRVIRRLVRDLDMSVEVVACDTVREADGLAMSSRNVYLSAEERAAAPVIAQALTRAKRRFGDGERSAEALRALVRDQIAAEPLAAIDYVSLADSDTLAEIESAITSPAVISVAVRFGPVRLIDNIELE